MTPAFLSRIVNKVLDRDQAKQTIIAQYADSSFLFPRPFITIARDPGSGGAPIGKEVAERLGFAFYDQELLEEMAKSSKVRREVLQDVDEKSRTVIQDFVHSMLNPDYVSDVTLLKHLSQVVATIAYKGNVVILGRGACHLTPRASGLHVRITAPLTTRLERATHYEGHTPRQAKLIVQKFEKDRKEFVKQYFGKSITDPLSYDLTLNTEFLPVADSADLIVKGFFAKFPQAFPKVQQLLIRAKR